MQQGVAGSSQAVAAMLLLPCCCLSMTAQKKRGLCQPHSLHVRAWHIKQTLPRQWGNFFAPRQQQQLLQRIAVAVAANVTCCNTRNFHSCRRYASVCVCCSKFIQFSLQICCIFSASTSFMHNCSMQQHVAAKRGRVGERGK